MQKKAERIKATAIPAIKVEAKEKNLGLIRKFIGARMKSAGFRPDQISALAVSVTEHCENLIRHAYKKKSGRVLLKLEVEHPEARIIAVDSGPKFNMNKHKIPDTAGRLKKGLGGKMGIKTIMSMCDTVEYKRTAGRNVNTFIIRVKKHGKGKK